MARYGKEGKGFLSGKNRVKQFNEVFELLGSTGVDVLKLLGAGNTASQAARVIGCTKSNITYHKNKLVRLGLLKLQTHDVVKIYRLTMFGSKVLTRGERVGRERIALEDFAVKFRVLGDEQVGLDWRRLGSPRNWVKLGVRVGGVRVVKTSCSVIVHPGKLWGWDPRELLFEAGGVVERVRDVLEGRFGMVLGDVGVPLHKPVFRFYSWEASELARLGTTVVEGVGMIDNSPPERVPHEEFFGEELAKERLLLPVRVRRLEQKIDDLQSSVTRLVDVLTLLAEPRAVPGKSGRSVDYVR